MIMTIATTVLSLFENPCHIRIGINKILIANSLCRLSKRLIEFSIQFWALISIFGLSTNDYICINRMRESGL